MGPGGQSALAPTPQYEGYGASQGLSPRAYVKDETLVVEEPAGTQPQTFYLAQGIRNIQLPYEAKIEVSIVQQEDVPEGVPIAQPYVRYMAPGGRAVAFSEPERKQSLSQRNPQDPIYAGPMDPIVTHEPPGMRAIKYRSPGKYPEILTQQGVMTYSRFEHCLGQEEQEKALLNLPPHPLVPMSSKGVPSLRRQAEIHIQHADRIHRLGMLGEMKEMD